jgi:ketosteroid isomerase-like protein
MSIKENKALVRRVIDFANRRDMHEFWTLFAPELVFHDATGDKSFEQYKQHTTMVFRGTHKNNLADIAPTGKKVDVTVMQIARIVDGRVVEFWHYPDEFGLRQQLGVIPFQ